MTTKNTLKDLMRNSGSSFEAKLHMTDTSHMADVIDYKKGLQKKFLSESVEAIREHTTWNRNSVTYALIHFLYDEDMPDELLRHILLYMTDQEKVAPGFLCRTMLGEPEKTDWIERLISLKSPLKLSALWSIWLMVLSLEPGKLDAERPIAPHILMEMAQGKV